jgi:hypothetical protein
VNVNAYLNWGELDDEAIDARAESPGSCGKEALWWSVEFCVEVEEGLDMGSMSGSVGLPSSIEWSVLNDGRSRACSLEGGGR